MWRNLLAEKLLERTDLGVSGTHFSTSCSRPIGGGLLRGAMCRAGGERGLVELIASLSGRSMAETRASTRGKELD